MEPITLSTKHLHFTDEDFYIFCMDNPNLKFERDSDGRIIIMANTGGETGNINSEINLQLRLWNKKYKLGKVFDSSTAFLLPNKAVRSPDSAWVEINRWESLGKIEKIKFPPLCPDFIIELKSDSDELQDLQKKVTDEWMQNGCKMTWLIDPYSETIYVYQAEKEVQVITGFDKTIGNYKLLPSFEFDLKELKII